MLLDISELEADKAVEADVCIAGAGAAGVTLARRFLQTGTRVLLLESGGTDFEPQIQALAEGENTGLPYYSLADARLRFFGGTTAIWGGRSAQMDAIDFRRRSWVPHSGWPIQAETLTQWYPKARQALGLPDMPQQEALWTSLGIEPPAFNPDRLSTALWQFDQPPGRFALRNCDDLVKSRNITIITHATVRHIQAEADGERVRQVDIASPGGHSGSVKAHYFVLAAGGLENPRLLLNSDDVHPGGLGNSQDLVGRFFMEHPHARGGRVVTRQLWKLLKMFRKTRVHGQETAACLRPGDALQEERGGLNTSFMLACRQHPDTHLSAPLRLYHTAKHKLSPSRRNRSLWLTTKKSVKYLQGFTDPLRPWLMTRFDRRGLYAVIRAEQAPNPDSRVKLGSDTDALGMRKIQLDWRTCALDKQGARVAMQALDTELRRLKIGHVELSPWLKDAGNDWEFDPLISAHAIGGFHHMGTTRMADHPSRGVVDEHCRVFGLDNLYVAGSSVFPTGGWANPTLTLVALSLRLGDHLIERLARDATPVEVQEGQQRNIA